jgi:hypothetical protein
MERIKLITTLCAVVALSTGCASTKEIDTSKLSPYEEALKQEHERTGEILSKAALLTSKSFAVYTRTNQAKVQPLLTNQQIRQARHQKYYVPNGMEDKQSYSWDSAPEPLLITLANASGYKLKFVNERPPVSRSVTVSPDRRQIKDFFDIITQQTEGYIDKIDIDDKSEIKLITVIYSRF